MKLTVLTYNIHHGRGTDKKLDLGRIADVIRGSGADIVGLNEVDRYFSARSGYEDQIHYLSQELGMHYAFGPALAIKAKEKGEFRHFGNGLLSRFPILESKNHRYDFFPGMIEGRALLEATLNLKGRPCKAFVTHLSLNPFLHRLQRASILAKASQNSVPVILFGDWNRDPRSQGMRKISSRLTDVWAVCGNGPGHTFPANRPRVRLDYIFVNHHFTVISAEVPGFAPEASDHLPVKAVLELKEPSTSP